VHCGFVLMVYMDADVVEEPEVSDTGVLLQQLMHLSSVPNQFQCHAQASLRLLERRRRCPVKPHMKPTVQLAVAQAKNNVSDVDCQASDALPEGKPAIDDCKSATDDGHFAMKEVRSDPLLARSREMQVKSMGSTMPCVNSAPLLDLGSCLEDAWPHDVYSLLKPAVECEYSERIEASNSGLRLHCGAYQIPHPRKAESGGEDSYFACQTGAAAGVADGVGEWEWRFGLNPRAFADELMAGAQQSAIGSVASSTSAKDRAAKALEHGFDVTKSFGSATALVAALDSSGSELGVANLGDSGLRQIRRRHEGQPDFGTRVIKRTDDQQHSFNCPYQLARLPTPADFPTLRAQGKTALVRAVQNTPTSRQDIPQDAQMYSMPVKEGDLLILGTDGVFDNLHDHEVCQLADIAMSPLEARQVLDLESGCLSGIGSTEPKNVAKAIAKAALLRSTDRSARTPFSLNAKDAGLCHYGGKMDDITVVAAWVVRTS